MVIKELENWRHLLNDAKFKFEVWIDYKLRIFHESTKIE